MGNHGAKAQKRLEKKKAKRQEKRTQLARISSPDPTIRLRNVDRWPILECLVTENLFEIGMGQVVIARQTPGGEIAFAVYLLDTFCLGVKNCLWTVDTPQAYREMMERLRGMADYRKVTPEYFSKLVHRAADYGQSLGFPPHHDFRYARLLTEGIDPSACPTEFTFGKNGKPVYISGPNDDPARSAVILSRLEAADGDNPLLESTEDSEA